MKLTPKRPPGRVDRKAAAYAADIAELRNAGYTYEAIRDGVARCRGCGQHQRAAA